MNSKAITEKYRKLSIASLVTGIIPLSLGVLYNFLWMPISNFLRSFIDVGTIPYVMPHLYLYFLYYQ
jgi:hypothetical protein